MFTKRANELSKAIYWQKEEPSGPIFLPSPVKGSRASTNCQIVLTSPPSMRSIVPVMNRAGGDTKNAISSAISSGWP